MSTTQNQTTTQWAPRDASWYSRPRSSGIPRWHVVGKDGVSVCGLPALLDIDRASEQAPSVAMQCTRCARRIKLS